MPPSSIEEGLIVKRFLYLLAVPFGLFSLFGIAQGEGPQVERDLGKIVAQIHATYEKINDLQSGFVQTVEIMDFNIPYVSKGRLFIKKG
ncbi:MAG: outer membrane lipoprotein carrier protein LolA, partial [Nitrospiria bacterium]